MADHLVLPPPTSIPSRRIGGNPTPEVPPVFRRGARGAGLTRTLQEIEKSLPESPQEDEEEDDEDPADLLVLKFSADTRLESSALRKLEFQSLGEGDGWTFFLLSSRDSRRQFAELVLEYSQLLDGPALKTEEAKAQGWDKPANRIALIDHITGVEVYGRDDRGDDSLSELVFNPTAEFECIIWPSDSQKRTDERIQFLRAVVTDAGPPNRVVSFDPRPDTTQVRVRGTRTLLARLLEVAVVERIQPPLSALITDEVYRAVQPSQFSGRPSARTPIGIIDTLVNVANPLTKAHVRGSESFLHNSGLSENAVHGTGVAGNAIWGDLDPLVEGKTLGAPHPVISASVMGHREGEDTGRLEVAGTASDTIRAAVEWMVSTHGVRIINISINDRNYPRSAALKSPLTAEIDRLARDLHIVIVVSAGNRVVEPESGWLDGYPGYLTDTEAGLTPPADAANVITVGSHAQRHRSDRASSGAVGIAQPMQPSPFTRLGPVTGPGSRRVLKPEFSHHGGNWSVVQGEEPDREDPGTSAVVAVVPRAGRIVGAANGTSYAAPIVAREIARIAERYPDADANMLRALAALSARPAAQSIRGIENQRWQGYGQPDATRVLESTGQRVFLTANHTIECGTVAVHEVPIPAEYADGQRTRTFRFALAFDPPVRRSRREYVAGIMTVELVRGISLSQVQQIYRRQPNSEQLESDPKLAKHDLPDGVNRPSLTPPLGQVQHSTLIRREYTQNRWDPDHRNYFLVVTHTHSPWTPKQKREYSEQQYSLVVEIADESRTDLDLYTLIQGRLRGRTRGRIGPNR